MIDVIDSQYFCHECGGWSLRMFKTLERTIEAADSHITACEGYKPRRVIHGDY